MNTKQLIEKAKQIAKMPDELQLTEELEHYIALYEMLSSASPEDTQAIIGKLQETFASLTEIYNRLTATYNISNHLPPIHPVNIDEKHQEFSSFIENFIHG